MSMTQLQVQPQTLLCWVDPSDLSYFTDNADTLELYGHEIGTESYNVSDPHVWRVVDPTYYTYLRRLMEKAKNINSEDKAKLTDETYETLRTNFNAIHAYALSAFGEPALLNAVKQFDIPRVRQAYAPPSVMTCKAYWEGREAREKEERDRETARLAKLNAKPKTYPIAPNPGDSHMPAKPCEHDECGGVLYRWEGMAFDGAGGWVCEKCGVVRR